jgi:hypothetical protein
MAEATVDISPKVTDENMYSSVLTYASNSGNDVIGSVENADQFQYHYFEFNISGISGTVVMRVEGTLSGNGWFNLSADDTDTSYTTNGTYLLSSTRGLRCKNVRLRKVSGTGTIQAYYRGGN